VTTDSARRPRDLPLALLSVAAGLSLSLAVPIIGHAAEASAKGGSTTVEGRVDARGDNATGSPVAAPSKASPARAGGDAASRDATKEPAREADESAAPQSRRDRSGRRSREQPMTSEEAIDQLSHRIAEKLAAIRAAQTGSTGQGVASQPRLTVKNAPGPSTPALSASPAARPVRTALNGSANATEVARTAALANGQPVASLATSTREAVAPVAALSGPSPSAARRAGSTLGATGAASAVDGHREGASHVWSYAGEFGPQNWGSIDPAWARCASGQRQSPIDIREGIQVDLAPITFQYAPGPFSVVDTGHTIQVNVAAGNSIEVMGRRYELQQFHFHKPSEARIAGRLYDMEAHLVHRDAEGRLAVVAVLLQRGRAQPVIQSVWSNLPLERNESLASSTPLDVAALLPAERGYYTFMGSLTSPPCTEGVLWMVMKSPVEVSEAQIGIFSRLYPMNARPIQMTADRMIKESN
jgi:carbonic anhydrase